MNPPHAARKYFFLISVAVVALDRLTKYIVEQRLPLHESVSKRAFGDAVLAHAILCMPTDRHMAETRHVRKVMLHFARSSIPGSAPASRDHG